MNNNISNKENYRHMSRITNVLNNTAMSIACYTISCFSAFIYRTVFIHYLNSDYLGLQGVLTNILQMLSLADLGIGSAMVFSMYKPLYEKDFLTLSALVNFYKNTYRIIAIVVCILGVFVLPFLNFFIGDAANIKEPIYVIYLLYLLNSVISYLYAYKQSLLCADQREYLVSICTAAMQIIKVIFQITTLVLWRSFVFTLIVQIICTFIQNWTGSYIAKKQYSHIFAQPIVELKPDAKVAINDRVFAMMKYRIGAYIIDGTDNLLISKLCGLTMVGIYSNYLLIISVLRMLIGYLTKAFTPSVGHYEAQNGKDAMSQIILEINFIFFVIGCVITVCIYGCINPFIRLWIGSEYVFNDYILIVICLNFYITSMHQAMLIFRNALGLYTYMQFKPIAEATINLFVAILGGIYYGISGILAATSISFFLTSFWIEPYVLYKKYKIRGWDEYWKLNIGYLLTVLIAVGCTTYVRRYLIVNNISAWFLSAGVHIALTILIIIFIFVHAPVFHTSVYRIKNYLYRGK